MGDQSPPHSPRSREKNQDTQKIIPFPPADDNTPKEAPPSHGGKVPPIIFTSKLPKVPEEKLNPEKNQVSSTATPTIDGDLDTADLPPALPFMNTLLGLKLPLSEGGSPRQTGKDEGKLTSILKELGEKADFYADNMFDQSEVEHDAEVNRLERLIPGTDQEEFSRGPAPSRRKKRPLPPDVNPRVMVQRYGKDLSRWGSRRNGLILLVVVSTVLTVGNATIESLFPWVALPGNKALTLGILLLIGLILGRDLLKQGVFRGLQGRIGMDTLQLFTGLSCLGDCLFLYTNGNESQRLPCVALVLMTLTLGLHGQCDKLQAHQIACRVVAKVKNPDLLLLEPNKWNGKSAYVKCPQEATGFTSQLQCDDGTELLYSLLSPIILIGALMISGLSAQSVADFFWAFTVILAASTPCGCFLAYGRGALKVSKRLEKIRVALAGWPGVEKAGRRCVLGDTDLFPVGSTSLSGIRILEGFKEKKVVAYTTSLLEEGEVGVSRIFSNMMSKHGLMVPPPREVLYHEGGGISALINQDQVMVGCAAFMELMEVSVPDGLHLPHAIFCTINGHLAGIFALDYEMSPSVSVCLDMMQSEGVKPVLGTRDFAIEPRILGQRFHLKEKKIEFPSISRRRELSQGIRAEDSLLVGILCREGIESLCDGVISAKRLRKTTWWAGLIVVTSSVLGFFLTGYLVSQDAYSALATDNLLIFMMLWLAPVWVVTDLPHRF